MKAVQIILGCIVAAVAIACGVYAGFAARGKGPVLVNDWLWASQEERRRMDKKPLYKTASKAFFGIALIFALLSVSIFTGWKWSMALMYVMAAVLVIWAIAQAVKSEIKKK